MSLVLINPPTLKIGWDIATKYISPPIGLAYVSAYLRKYGFETLLIDGIGLALEQETPLINNISVIGLSADDILRIIPIDTKYVGISCMFSKDWVYIAEIARTIKNKWPEIIIIGGGEHISAVPEFSLKHGLVDYCVIGEGEETMKELLSVLMVGGKTTSVNGIAYMEDGSFLRNRSRKRISNLLDMPYPDWEQIPLKNYFNTQTSHGASFERTMPIIAARGCPFQCTFCSNLNTWQGYYTYRKPEEVVKEMGEYYKWYKVKNFLFCDLTLPLKKKWILDFCEYLRISGLEVTWELPSGTRSEVLDKEVLTAMFQNGCCNITYAPESGSEITLKNIKKHISKRNMFESMKTASAIGIKVKANFIIGFPEETRRDAFKTLGFYFRLALEGIDDATIVPFALYPGSNIYEQFILSKRIGKDFDNILEIITYNSSYSHLIKLKSWNKDISSIEIKIICIFSYILFYCIAFLRHPSKLIKIIFKRDTANSRFAKLVTNIVLRK